MIKKFIDLPKYKSLSVTEMVQNSAEFYSEMNLRRTVRDFSPESFDREIIENCIKTAGSAPSGANKQPWHFVVVSDPEIKKEIRIAAEKE